MKENETAFTVSLIEYYEKGTPISTNNAIIGTEDEALCAYIQMNYMSKEIAPLLNISIREMETGRYRFFKKRG